MQGKEGAGDAFLFTSGLLLLLLLSHFSRVWLCATPQTAAHQVLPSLGFSRQEHWSGLPFPSPRHESEKWMKSFSHDPMDCSPSGSSVHGMIHSAFSNLLKNLVEFHCLYGGPIFLLLFVLIPLLLWRHLSFLRFQADWPVTWGHWWIKEKLWFHRYFSLIVSVGWLSFQLLPY